MAPVTTFVMLSTLGPDGAATLLAHPDRLRAVNAEVESMGAKVLHQWALLGAHDFCTVLEAPDEKVMAQVAVVLGARGTLKTLTMTAVNVDDLLATLAARGD